jgi:hypothetical protein
MTDKVVVPIDDRLHEIRDLLTRWQKEAARKAHMHEASRRYYKRLNYAYMIPIILASTATGTVNLLAASSGKTSCEDVLRPDAGINYVQMILGIGGLASACATGVYNFTRISELLEAHAFYKGQFENLARKIEVETLLADTTGKTYSDIGSLLKDVREDFDRLCEKAPGVPAFIERNHPCTAFPKRP